jgi:Ca2+-binding RTX toxin-like protein
VRGGAGRDVVAGSTGDDTMTGGTGPDTFVFRQFDGKDVITDFFTGSDKLKIDVDGIDSFADIRHIARQVGHDTVLDFAGNIDEITLKNVSVSSLHASDFVF